MDKGTNALLFRDVPCGLMKLKLNIIDIMSIVTTEAKMWKTANLKTSS